MPSNKKILYVASTASHLRRFHQPYIQALGDHATIYTMANGEGVDYCIPFAKSFFSPANLKCIFQVRKILKREHFDAVLLHTTLASVLVRLALPMHKRPYVLNFVHGYLFPLSKKGLKNRFLFFCERLLRCRTDDIAVMNREDLEIAARNKLCCGKVYMTHGMGIPDSLDVPSRDSTLRLSLGVSENEFLCTFVGELSGRKNQSFLITQIARLRNDGIPVKLLLLGEGCERATLERQIEALGLSDVVLLLGNREPVMPYLSVTDLYVSASHSEGLPFNIMEAMAVGLPILASDTKGQSDLLDSVEGALYAPLDGDGFCRAVTAYANNKQCGVGSYIYPMLRAYRLNAVFEENMKILMLGLD